MLIAKIMRKSTARELRCFFTFNSVLECEERLLFANSADAGENIIFTFGEVGP